MKVVFNSTGLLSALILCLSAAAQQSVYRDTNKLPNIIYIYADDLGYGELGCYGQEKIRTPHLDQLAREGMRFVNHYTGAPVCAPARGILMTGKHAGHAYIRGNYELGGFADTTEAGQMPLPEGTITLPKMLKQAGYITAAIGKWGLGMVNNTGHPNKQGFDYFYGYLDQKQAHNYYPTHLWENDHWDSLDNPPIDVHKPLDANKATDEDLDRYAGKEYAPEKMTGKALQFLEKNRNRKFFLYLPYPLPHVSLQVPAAYIDKYRGQFKEKIYYGEQGYAPVKYPLSAHAAMVTYLDEQVGIILKKIKDLGLDENTLIMFSSDNGGAWDGGLPKGFFDLNGGLRGQKRDLYEGGIREPFIVRWPGKIKPGSTSDLISAQYDIMPTLAQLSGTKAGNTDGISMLAEWLGKTEEQQTHPYLYFEFGETGGAVAIRMGKWKGVKTGLKKNPHAPWQLYDLNTDPAETSDIAALHPDILKQFDTIVKKEHQDAHIREWEFIDAK